MQSKVYQPKISIIIATYNAENLIEKTLESIIYQTYENYEIIVIDGNSSDTTMLKVSNYSCYINHIVSEPDNGIYDAWNKGIILAKGDWISFLGAGDIYYPDGLRSYVDYILSSHEELDFVSSQIEMVNSFGKVLFKVGAKWEWPKLLKVMTVAHVGSMHSRNLFEIYGLFNSSYKIAGDYELLLRPKDCLKAGYLAQVTVKMLYGGVSSSMKIFSEIKQLKIKTGGISKRAANFEFFINS